ncbi:MAG: hypothetical protein M1826_004993 [Phylliscum demangeonii]|nr:MAG: hypothetical protein M1826_004993 [Phylliscum demangeonii]
MFPPILALLLLLHCGRIAPVVGQAVTPLAERCGPASANIVCISHYTAVMPGDFWRRPINNSFEPSQDVGYEGTLIASDPSWALAAHADFLVFDRARGLAVLGPQPTNQFRFAVADVFHDAPVYAPNSDELYFSQLQPGFLAQLVVNLTADPPTLSSKTADPPLYSANGAWFSDGLIYYCVGGGNRSVSEEVGGGAGRVARPGVYTLNTTSGRSNVVLNNYFGHYFNSCDDITVDAHGDVWFTDNDYAWGNRVDENAPVLGSATYRFRPRTGAVYLVEDTLQQPNGIAFAPDGQTLYLSDTGAIAPLILPQYGMRGYLDYNVTSPHTVYAFDVCRNGTALVNRRPVYLSKQWIPDGLKVARNGYLLTGTGGGVDVLDPDGTLLLTIKTNYTAVNVNWSGKDFETLWIVGVGGVSEISLDLPGPILS